MPSSRFTIASSRRAKDSADSHSPAAASAAGSSAPWHASSRLTVSAAASRESSREEVILISSPKGARKTVSASKSPPLREGSARKTVAASVGSASGGDRGSRGYRNSSEDDFERVVLPVATAASSVLSHLELDDLYDYLESLCKDHISSYLQSRVDPNDKVVAGVVTKTTRYQPADIATLLQVSDENVVEVSVVHALTSTNSKSLGPEDLKVLAELLMNGPSDKKMVKLLLAIVGTSAQSQEELPLFCSCASRSLSHWASDHDVVRVGLAVLFRLLHLSAHLVANACGDVLTRLVKIYTKDDAKTLAMLNLVLSSLAHTEAGLLVEDTGLVAALATGLETMSKNGFPMQVHLQVQAAGIEFFTVVANTETGQGANFALVKILVNQGAAAYAARLFRTLHGSSMALERFVLDFLVAVAHDADQTEALMQLGVFKLAWEAIDRLPLRAARLLAYLSMTRQGSMQILGISSSLADRLTRLVMVDDLDLASCSVIVGKNIAMFNPDFMKDLKDRNWFPRVVELFTRCCLHPTEEHSLVMDLVAFMHIAAALNHSAAAALVDLNVIPVALHFVLLPGVKEVVISKVFHLFDLLVVSSQGAQAWLDNKGVSIAVSMLCNHPEDRELVLSVILALDHCAAVGPDFASRVSAGGTSDAVDAIREAYVDDDQVAKLCDECAVLLSHGEDAPLPRRVFAASSVASGNMMEMPIGGGGSSSGGGDPLKDSRNLLLAGSLMTEWVSGHKRVPKHVAVSPEMSSLIFKDVSAGHKNAMPFTVFFRDLRSCYIGVESDDKHFAHKPVFTLVARGVTKILECQTEGECHDWVDALHIILHLVRHGDTRWIKIVSL